MKKNRKRIPSDIEIAHRHKMADIDEIAAGLGLKKKEYEKFGHFKAKLSRSLLKKKDRGAKIILVSAITPTPAGEGKTTVSVGLCDAINRLKKKASVVLREPSLGPCFGIKGGAAGGGYSQVLPMEDINLHFTGDFHAVGLAHNLLAAAVDNHIFQGNKLNIDSRRITWKRVLDMNDRALRNIVCGLGGPSNGVPRESGFDITAASEIMAVLCLSENFTELKKRLGDIVVGLSHDKKPVTARDLKTEGAMGVLLKDAMKPNLVQTLEKNPAIIHGGPFANIAHGCNSIIATRTAMKLSDYVVTEAGFGADLGAEKFINIKCRKTGLKPGAVVLVATIRALKMHGRASARSPKGQDMKSLDRGLANLRRHIENLHNFGLPVIVALNSFSSDTKAEIELIKERCSYLGVSIIETRVWEKGSSGGLLLAKAVIETVEETEPDFRLTYDNNLSLWEKTRTVAIEIYGADDIEADMKTRNKFRELEAAGYGKLPVCIAKTQYSFSTDPALTGNPRGFNVPVRDVYVAAGAGFVTVLTGNIMTMPGLPPSPASEKIDIDSGGVVSGLF